MHIIDSSYLLSILIIILGTPCILYLKYSIQDVPRIHIVIYGASIESAMLAYYIDKRTKNHYLHPQVNITLISAKIEQSNKNNTNQAYMNFKKSDQRIISFCGVQHQLQQFMKNIHLNNKIKSYNIYFAEISNNQYQNHIETYQIKQQYPFRSVLQYGLSHFTAKNFFHNFQQYLKLSKQYKYSTSKLSQLSMKHIIDDLIPEQEDNNGLKYLGEQVGLDQPYLRDFIAPVIWSNYLQEANSITTMFKLLPLYCSNNGLIGSAKVLIETENNMKNRILQQVQINMQYVNNKTLRNYNILQNNSVIVTVSEHEMEQQQHLLNNNNNNNTYQDIKADVLFILQDYQMQNIKQISYYRTIVDGTMRMNDKQEQIYTIYFVQAQIYKKKKQSQENQPTRNQIYSATRICHQNCKNYNYDLYLLISKKKLSQTDLVMFQYHHIVHYQRHWLPKTQIPSTKQFQQMHHVYRISDIQTITDSYQVKLQVFKQTSKLAFLSLQQ